MLTAQLLYLLSLLFFPATGDHTITELPEPKEVNSPKREFRAVWVSTIFNLDWPSEKGLSVKEQQKEMIRIFDRCKELGMNAVIVQIRPSGDAFYKSAFEPWSEWLMGKQGQKPVPSYDPLQFMVEEAHKRQLEFHAWVNPFRAISHHRFSSVADQHTTERHPDWFFFHHKSYYFNPGNPEARKFVVKVVMDIVSRYDIDGLHFDDYFYPYPKPDHPIQDQEFYNRYGKKFKRISDWRRNNIDLFIQDVSKGIRNIKPHVKFGVSPIGVWRNKNKDKDGSDTNISSTYDNLYADVRKWIREGWVDYMAPQMYWDTQHKNANYGEILNWWADNSYERHVYVGHAFYKQEYKIWKSRKEINLQIDMRRKRPEFKGGAFFSAKSLFVPDLKADELLGDQAHKYPALVPEMSWKDSIPPLAPTWAEVISFGGDKLIRWGKPIRAADGEYAHEYVLYGFDADEEIDLTNARNIIQTLSNTWTIDKRSRPAGYRYIISSLDRLKNESTGYIIAQQIQALSPSK